jgi:hypothetical protein
VRNGRGKSNNEERKVQGIGEAIHIDWACQQLEIEVKNVR